MDEVELEGRFQIFQNDLHIDLENFAQYIQRNFQFPVGHHFKIRQNAKKTVGASAYFLAQEKTYVASINQGLVAWVYEIALASAEMVNTSFATAQNLQVSKSFQAAHLSFSDYSKWIKSIDQRYPNQSHDQFAKYVFKIGIYAILIHEVAHILRGHLDHKKSKMTEELNIIEELDIFKIDEAKNTDAIIAYEYDADHYTAALLEHLICDDPVLFPEMASLEETAHLSYTLLFYALFYSVLEASANRVDNRANSHPSPMVRFTILLSTLRTNWLHKNPASDFDETVFLNSMRMFSNYDALVPAIRVFEKFMDKEWRNQCNREILEIIGQFEIHQRDLETHIMKQII